MKLLGYAWVGLHCFSVYEAEQIKIDGEDVDGVCDREGHFIKVKAGMPVSRQREVLMHELMHLAFYHSQLAVENTKYSEETVCTRLAPALAEILNKNAWISAFIEDRTK